MMLSKVKTVIETVICTLVQHIGGTMDNLMFLTLIETMKIHTHL